MDGRPFDSWVRTLGTTTSRRGTLRALAGGAAAAALARFGGAEAATCPRSSCCKCTGRADDGTITRACAANIRNTSECIRFCRLQLGEGVERTVSFRNAPRGTTAVCSADAQRCRFVRCDGWAAARHGSRSRLFDREAGRP